MTLGGIVEVGNTAGTQFTNNISGNGGVIKCRTTEGNAAVSYNLFDETGTQVGTGLSFHGAGVLNLPTGWSIRTATGTTFITYTL